MLLMINRCPPRGGGLFGHDCHPGHAPGRHYLSVFLVTFPEEVTGSSLRNSTAFGTM